MKKAPIIFVILLSIINPLQGIIVTTPVKLDAILSTQHLSDLSDGLRHLEILQADKNKFPQAACRLTLYVDNLSFGDYRRLQNLVVQNYSNCSSDILFLGNPKKTFIQKIRALFVLKKI